MPPALTYKPVRFDLQELKARDDGWSFSGYASTFGNVDEGGDVVLRGAFLQSLQRRPSPKLLWQHDVAEPLGKVVSLKEDERGLLGEFKISKTARGHDAYQLLKDGALDSMSIGYIPEEQDFDEKTGVRQLKSVDLLEISVVSIPMNEQAVITAIKSAAKHVPPHRVIAELKAWIVELEASAGSDAAPPTTPVVVAAVHKARLENRLRRARLLGLVVGDRAS